MDDLEKLLVGGSVLKDPLRLKDFSDAELIEPEVATAKALAASMLLILKGFLEKVG